MSLTAVLLLTLSAFIHAGWNLLSKRSHPAPAMFLLSSLASVVLLLPVGFIYGNSLPGFPPLVWVLLIAAGMFQAVYFSGLAWAYRSGDLSVAYPLARSLPVILVAIYTLLSQGRNPFSPLYFLGLAMVVVGCLILPLEAWKDFSLRRIWVPTTLFALLAAVGTAGYSIVDDAALRILRSLPGPGSLPVTIQYSLCENLATAFWLGLFVLAQPFERHNLFAGRNGSWKQAFIMAACITLAYTIVLFAMGFTTNVSYIVTFRQLSIPLGALAGVFILKEPMRVTKAAGVLCVFAGLILVGIG